MQLQRATHFNSPPSRRARSGATAKKRGKKLHPAQFYNAFKKTKTRVVSIVREKRQATHRDVYTRLTTRNQKKKKRKEKTCKENYNKKERVRKQLPNGTETKETHTNRRTVQVIETSSLTADQSDQQYVKRGSDLESTHRTEKKKEKKALLRAKRLVGGHLCVV